MTERLSPALYKHWQAWVPRLRDLAYLVAHDPRAPSDLREWAEQILFRELAERKAAMGALPGQMGLFERKEGAA
jgi:hypothetical protein